MNKLVEASSVLSSAPEKEVTPSYNLLVHIVLQSSQVPEHIPAILAHLAQPLTNSSHNGPAVVISILTTLFNVIPTESSLRLLVFTAILKTVQKHGFYDVLAPQLKHLQRWFGEWAASPDDIRAILVTVADIAEEAGDEEQAYSSLLTALQTFTPPEASTAAAHTLAVRIVKSAISQPARLDFDDLVALDSVQALAKSDPELFNLFEVFAGGDLEDYEEFNDVHDNWLEDNNLSHSVLLRKIRLLTLASLSTRTPTRALPYKNIAKALHIPSEDVEMWVIDVIRAGLVEGKLSQLNQTFLIHRSSYRVFGLDQWVEVGERLDVWRDTLRNISEIVKQARENVGTHEKNERDGVEKKLENLGRNNNQNSKAVEVDA